MLRKSHRAFLSGYDAIRAKTGLGGCYCKLAAVPGGMVLHFEVGDEYAVFSGAQEGAVGVGRGQRLLQGGVGLCDAGGY